MEERLNDQSKMLNAHAVMLDHFHWSIARITEDTALPVPPLPGAIRSSSTVFPSSSLKLAGPPHQGCSAIGPVRGRSGLPKAGSSSVIPRSAGAGQGERLQNDAELVEDTEVRHAWRRPDKPEERVGSDGQRDRQEL